MERLTANAGRRKLTWEKDLETRQRIVEVEDEAATEKFGLDLGKVLAPGDVVGLVGNLGAGKTALTRAIAAGAGIPASTVVNSPTFTILNIYAGPELDLYHLDLYRIEDPEELEGLALADLLDSGGALVVEWFDTFPEAFPDDALTINIEITSENSRRFILEAGGPKSRELLEQLNAMREHPTKPHALLRRGFEG